MVAMLNLSEFRKAGQYRLVDWLPWACLVAPGVVLNKDGSFQRTVRYRGPDLDSATESELVSVAARVNNALKRFGSNWALFFDAERQNSVAYPRSRFPDAVSFLIDEERRIAFEQQAVHFESHYRLTFVWLPPPERVSTIESLFWRDTAADSGKTEAAFEQLVSFCRQTDRAIDLLAPVLPHLELLGDAETLTYLHSCVSTRHHPVAVPEIPAYIDAFLCDEPLAGGVNPRLGQAHLRSATVLGFPSVSVPGILDDLNRLDIAYRWTTRFIALDRTDAGSLIRKIRRQWFAKRKSLAAIVKEVMFSEAAALIDPDAASKSADADHALEELGDDLVAFGYVTTTVVVLDENERVADEKLRLVERTINARGFSTIRETLNNVEAWLGTLPGHTYANLRQPVIHTLNLAHLCPLSAVWAGPTRNEHLDGPPLLIAKTNGATPFRLNLHVGDVGHCLIVGPTGAGKSVLIALLALQFRRYARSQIIIFDKGRSARATTLALDGAWYALGGDTDLAFQPLAGIDAEASCLWALDWLCGLSEGEGITITPEVKETLWSALRNLACAPLRERTLTGLVALLSRDGLRRAIEPFTLEGPYGRYLDADQDRLAESDVITFEMEELMALPGLVAPVLTYLFHALDRRFDGSPTLLVLDEAWLFLDHRLFADRIRDWLKTLRKKNVAVLFATQSLADISESRIAPAIIESCPTRIFLPNPRAREPGQHDAYSRFGLNDTQIGMISEATPKRDYYLQSRAGNRLFELDLGPIASAVVGASGSEDQKLMDRVLAIAGPQQFAGAFLAAKGFSRAAEVLRLQKELRAAGATDHGARVSLN
jgi:type IV secretion/conjugal transfer VirB4 family ATPase